MLISAVCVIMLVQHSIQIDSHVKEEIGHMQTCKHTYATIIIVKWFWERCVEPRESQSTCSDSLAHVKSNLKQVRTACGIGTQKQREGCFLFRQVIFRPAVFCLLCFLSNTADCTATCCPQRHTTASFGLSDIAYVSFFCHLFAILWIYCYAVTT